MRRLPCAEITSSPVGFLRIIFKSEKFFYWGAGRCEGMNGKIIGNIVINIRSSWQNSSTVSNECEINHDRLDEICTIFHDVLYLNIGLNQSSNFRLCSGVENNMLDMRFKTSLVGTGTVRSIVHRHGTLRNYNTLNCSLSAQLSLQNVPYCFVIS